MDRSAPPLRPAIDWRVFLRGLAEEVDSMAGAGERDDLLRGVGRRMARMVPLPPVQSLPALELEVNDALSTLGWGEAEMRLHEADRQLRITHTGLPRIGSMGSPPGQWLGAVLEGLYDGWLGQQPGSKAALGARRTDSAANGAVVIGYGRRS